MAEKSPTREWRDEAHESASSEHTLPVDSTDAGLDTTKRNVEAEKEVPQVASTDEEVQYPGGVTLSLIALALCLSIFLVALDSTIVATAIPAITNEFKSLNDIGWYGSAYLLTTAAFQLVFGKLYTFYNIKWVFVWAIAIFELGSLICAVAPNSVALIVGRAIAGLGSAGVFSGCYLIIATCVPLAKRPAFNGAFGGMYGISSVVGPLMGGAFTDNVTWRWCFYINLPIGGLAVAVILFFFKPGPKPGGVTTLTWKERIKQFDILGTLFFIPGVVCLLIALQWGGSVYPWSNGRIIALFVVFGICLIVFIGIQLWRPQYATISPIMLRKRTVWAAVCFAFTMPSAFFVAVYYLPIWFQAVKGTSAEQSGIDNIPILLAVVVGTIVSGAAISKIGYYTPFMIAATVLTSIGCGLLTTFQVDTGSPKWIGYQVLAGFGIGLGLQIPFVAIQTVLADTEIPLATALVMFMQTFGPSVWLSVAQSVLTNKLVTYIAETIPGIDAAAVANSGATSLGKSIPPEYLLGVIQTYNDALTQVFLIALVMACLTIVGSLAMEWNSVKAKPQKTQV